MGRSQQERPEVVPNDRGDDHTRVTEIAEHHKHDTQDLYTLLEDAQDGRTRISQRVAMDSQRVNLLMGDRMTLQETVWIVEEESGVVLPPQPHRKNTRLMSRKDKERKARTLLLMAVPKDHLRRFHGMDDAKEIWAAIKTSLEKGYDRFQKLLSQLDALGASVSDEDANHKFLRSLPPAWDSLAMTMRTKKNIDTLSIDDLYNNLSVFEQDIQKTSSSSLASDNVAFISQAKASSSKHKPSQSSGSYSSYTTSSSKATPTATPGLADEVIHSFLATNADDVDLIHEDLDQIDDLDLEEMDINWQIAMTAIKIKKFYKKTGRRPRVDGKMHVAFDKRKVEVSSSGKTDQSNGDVALPKLITSTLA
ncbi:hypothetical protein Tco_0613160 [Tanacetum coccineum]